MPKFNAYYKTHSDSLYRRKFRDGTRRLKTFLAMDQGGTHPEIDT